MPPSLKRMEIAIFLALLLLVLVALFGPPLAQPASYGHFADQRSWLGLPNTLDVLSNLPFALGGLWGCYLLLRTPGPAISGSQRALSLLFFVGLILTAICSGWYHLLPNDSGLALDRLGMAVAFSGLLGLAVAERISVRAGAWLALAMLVLGPLSVWVWLRSANVLPWALVQFGGMALVLVLLFFKPLPKALGVSIGLLIGLYALAKVFEEFDYQIYAWSGSLISGHTLKHLVASLAAWPVLLAIYRARGRWRAAY